MARIFITGSTDGLGRLAAKELIESRHQLVLYARNSERAQQASKAVRGARDILIADLASIEETKIFVKNANASGAFDAVIHNEWHTIIIINNLGSDIALRVAAQTLNLGFNFIANASMM